MTFVLLRFCSCFDDDDPFAKAWPIQARRAAEWALGARRSDSCCWLVAALFLSCFSINDDQKTLSL